MTNVKTILLIGRTGNGKSTLANVLLGKRDKNDNFEEIFGESAGSISKTKEIQIENFIDEETKIEYRIVDTVGIGDTKMTLDKVLHKLALMGYSVKDGLSQILFVTDGHLVKEAKSTYDLLRKVVFDENIAKYTTVIRTNFAGFMLKERCEEEEKKMIESSEEFKELIKGCSGVICVDNPPVDIDDVDLVKLYKKRREKSREGLLGHLKFVCQDDEVYRPINLIILSGEINEHMTKKEESNVMLEHIGDIDRELKKNIKEELKKLEEKEGKKEKPAMWKFGGIFVNKKNKKIKDSIFALEKRKKKAKGELEKLLDSFIDRPSKKELHSFLENQEAETIMYKMNTLKEEFPEKQERLDFLLGKKLKIVQIEKQLDKLQQHSQLKSNVLSEEREEIEAILQVKSKLKGLISSAKAKLTSKNKFSGAKRQEREVKLDSFFEDLPNTSEEFIEALENIKPGLSQKLTLSEVENLCQTNHDLKKLKLENEKFGLEDWMSIHKEFTKNLQEEWVKRLISYSEAQSWIGLGFKPVDYDEVSGWKKLSLSFREVKEWIKAGAEPNDYKFISWLRDIKKLTPEEVLNFGNGEALKREYQLGKNEQITSERSKTPASSQKRKQVTLEKKVVERKQKELEAMLQPVRFRISLNKGLTSLLEKLLTSQVEVVKFNSHSAQEQLNQAKQILSEKVDLERLDELCQLQKEIAELQVQTLQPQILHQNPPKTPK